MTSHVEEFVWGALNEVQTSIFGSSSSDIHDSDEWTRQLGGGGGGDGSVDAMATHISFEHLYKSIVSDVMIRDINLKIVLFMKRKN